MDGKKIVFAVVCATLFSGCSATVIGAEQTYCAENGADYSDAGVCDDLITIYKNRHALAALNSKSKCSNKYDRR